MCQLCAIKKVADSSPWPKPLRQQVEEFKQIADDAHTDVTNYHESVRKARENPQQLTSNVADLPGPVSQISAVDMNLAVIQAKAHLTLSIKTLVTYLEMLDKDRLDWWNSDQKKQQRRELEETGSKDLQELHTINNRCTAMIADAEAAMGKYVRWSMGVEGGLSALMEDRDGAAKIA